MAISSLSLPEHGKVGGMVHASHLGGSHMSGSGLDLVRAITASVCNIIWDVMDI